MACSITPQQTPTGNQDQFVTMGRKLAYSNGYTPQSGIDFYATTGTTIDTYYALFGVVGIAYEVRPFSSVLWFT